MDRAPSPAPFDKGTRLRYVGTQRAWVEDANGALVPYVELGLEVTVAETRAGHRGTLQPVPVDWEDDEPPLDTTRDGYSVYRIPVPGKAHFGRIIWPADAHEWKRV